MPTRNHARALLLAIFLTFLIFFRARWGMRLVNEYDDGCYVEWLHKILGMYYPPCYSKSHLPGVAVLWIPAGAFAWVVSLATRLSFESWLFPFIGVSAFAFWGASLFLFDRLARSWTSRSFSVWLPILFLLNVPVLEFAARLTFSTHPGELLVALCYVTCLAMRRFNAALFFLVLLISIRLNDFPAALLFVGMIFDERTRGGLTFPVKLRYGMLVAFSLVSVVAVALIYRVGFVTGYNGLFLPQILRNFSPVQVARIFLMREGGIVWVAPIWIVFCGLGLWGSQKLSWTARAALVWMAVETALVICLTNLRSDYLSPPWRYAIGSYVGAFLVWCEVTAHLPKTANRVAVLLLGIGAVWTSFQMFTYDCMTVSANLGVSFDWFTRPGTLRRLEFLRYPKALLTMGGISPVGFVAFSWCPGAKVFAAFGSYEKYALHGPELWVMTAATFVALVGITLILFQALRLKTKRLFKPN